MNKTIIWIWSILIITFITVPLFSISFFRPAYEIKAEPEEIDLGTFNACLIREATVTLNNTGRNAFVIDNIIADCGCIGITTKSDKILAGKKMDMIVEARQITKGKLSHEIVIVPKDKEHYKPIKISVSGNVIEPVSIEAGWFAHEVKKYDPNSRLELEPIQKLSAKLVISIISNNKSINFRNIIPDVNSSNYDLENYDVKNIISGSQKAEKLTLTLKPKDSLKIGMMWENIKIGLANDISLYIPLVSRIVGEAYVIKNKVSFGLLSDGGNKEITIYFTNNEKPWQNVKWNIEGDLGGVIDVSMNKSQNTKNSITCDLTVKKNMLENVPKGYNFGRLNFYQNDPQDKDAVSVLIDGFN